MSPHPTYSSSDTSMLTRSCLFERGPYSVAQASLKIKAGLLSQHQCWGPRCDQEHLDAVSVFEGSYLSSNCLGCLSQVCMCQHKVKLLCFRDSSSIPLVIFQIFFRSGGVFVLYSEVSERGGERPSCSLALGHGNLCKSHNTNSPDSPCFPLELPKPGLHHLQLSQHFIF